METADDFGKSVAQKVPATFFLRETFLRNAAKSQRPPKKRKTIPANVLYSPQRDGINAGGPTPVVPFRTESHRFNTFHGLTPNAPAFGFKLKRFGASRSVSTRTESPHHRTARAIRLKVGAIGLPLNSYILPPLRG